MYPGKLLSLTNKCWGWAPLLKHVGFEWKKWGTCNEKKERITRKVWRILEQLKWRSKDQNSKSSKTEDTRNQIKQGGEFKEIKD